MTWEPPAIDNFLLHTSIDLHICSIEEDYTANARRVKCLLVVGFADDFSAGNLVENVINRLRGWWRPFTIPPQCFDFKNVVE